MGLIQSLGNIRLGDLGTAAAAGVTTGIGQSLISTATGLIVAISSLVFYRLFQGFVVNQVKVFRRAGSDLELLYRQYWQNIPDSRATDRGSPNIELARPGENIATNQFTQVQQQTSFQPNVSGGSDRIIIEAEDLKTPPIEPTTNPDVTQTGYSSDIDPNESTLQNKENRTDGSEI